MNPSRRLSWLPIALAVGATIALGWYVKGRTSLISEAEKPLNLPTPAKDLPQFRPKLLYSGVGEVPAIYRAMLGTINPDRVAGWVMVECGGDVEVLGGKLPTGLSVYWLDSNGRPLPSLFHAEGTRLMALLPRGYSKAPSTATLIANGTELKVLAGLPEAERLIEQNGFLRPSWPGLNLAAKVSGSDLILEGGMPLTNGEELVVTPLATTYEPLAHWMGTERAKLPARYRLSYPADAQAVRVSLRVETPFREQTEATLAKSDTALFEGAAKLPSGASIVFGRLRNLQEQKNPSRVFVRLRQGEAARIEVLSKPSADIQLYSSQPNVRIVDRGIVGESLRVRVTVESRKTLRVGTALLPISRA